jgi:peptidoglycan/xylan/chitin deacetylase (PgdA/CDA1 family)
MTGEDANNGDARGVLAETGRTSKTVAYHEVVRDDSDYFYSISVEKLRFQLRLLCVSGFAPGISFDDGHASHYRYALPLLQEAGFHGLFFVIAGFTGRRPEYMNWAHLRELASLGHQIQSHGWSHISLKKCNNEELTEELKRSKHVLEDGLSSAVDSVSIPYGQCDDRVLRACAQAGYKHVYTSNPGLLLYEYDGIMIHSRLMVHRLLRPEQLRAYVTGRGIAFWRLCMEYRVKQVVKSMIGSTYYQLLWVRLADARDFAEIQQEYLHSMPTDVRERTGQ